MRLKKLIRTHKAVAGVIEALLLVALVATIISMIQLFYIKDVMEQREAEHMDEVSNQFSSIKSMIDIQSFTKTDVPIFSTITLGSKELPYFITARAHGALSIINDEDYEIHVNHGSIDTPLTSIKYEAYNSYFIDQTYVLEGGGIILNQPAEGEVMRVHPPISVTEDDDKVTIHFDLPVFIEIPGKNYTYNYTDCIIRTNYSGFQYKNYTSGDNVITFYTRYVDAWNESLNNILGDSVKITKASNYVQIERNGKDVKIKIKEIYIYAQIGPGWII